jgi:hypothetical protein
LTDYYFIKFPAIENKKYTDIHGLIFDKNEISVTPELRVGSMSVSLRQGAKICRLKGLSMTILMKSFYLSNVMPAIHPKRTYEQRDSTGFSEVSKDAFCAPIM